MVARTVFVIAFIAHLALLVSTTDSSPTSSGPDSVSSAPDTTECEQDTECPENEEYSYCTQALCRAKNCTEKGEPVKCVRLRPEFCLEGCVCKEGYLRAKNGTCIPEDKCPLNCGENEIENDCPADCESDYCPKHEGENQSCRSPDPCPPPACKCVFNYRRAENGTCIPTRSCPPFECKRPNEEFNPCPPLCPTDNCSQASPSGQCPRRFGRIGIVLRCNPKCRCIKGYWRKDEVCVPYGECPGVCPPNEKYSTCVQAECRALNCTQKDSPIACAAIAEGSCISGCICDEKYLRAPNGTCVPEDQCTPNCPENEVYTESKVSCPPDTCISLVAKFSCLADQPVTPGCKCASGHLRQNGTCVPICECPQKENSPDCQEQCIDLD